MSLLAQSGDSTIVYKKRILDNVEIDLLSSYYTQDGDHASVTGGIGTEYMTDLTPTIVISIPIKEDNVLRIDAGISAYTSASSSNVDPFDGKGATTIIEDDNGNTIRSVIGSPWVESSGASRKDSWINVNGTYSHYSDDRNTILSGNVSVAKEYDYQSIGFGASFSKLFNEKNTEVSLKGSAFLDNWSTQYPIEIRSFFQAGEDLNTGYFENINLLDGQGNIIDKDGKDIWTPFNSTLVENTNRGNYSLSLGFSQILSKNMQISLFADVIYQDGWLANPMQRVYFTDRANYYIGNPNSISNYANSSNIDVFQLADDIERFPSSRLKTPVGARMNYYVNESIVLRSYYRYYFDDWGVNSHTASLEVPVKISHQFTIIPSYRYYQQTAADYFAPFEQHLSTQEFYTSDYDLSKFSANQFGFGVSYTDIFTKTKLWKLGLKSVDAKYAYYERDSGLSSSIFSLGFKFILDKGRKANK